MLRIVPPLSNAGEMQPHVCCSHDQRRWPHQEGGGFSVVSKSLWMIYLSQPSSSPKGEDEVKSVASDEVVFSGRLVVRPGAMFVSIFALHML